MQTIPLSRPSITKEEKMAVTAVLNTGWIVEGQERDAFEQEFAQFIGAPYVRVTDGATSALFLSLKYLSIEPGDEVILPSLTFTATAEVVLHCGALVVFADVRPFPDMTLDPDDVARKRTKKTKAVIPVHMAGHMAHRVYDLPVIEDSAHLIRKGCFGGNLMAFSFHATKVMTTGRGGAVATNEKEAAEWFSKARDFGMTKTIAQRIENQSSEYDIAFPGWSHQMIDIAAAIGRVQLKRLPELLSKRQGILEMYNELLGENNTGLYIYPILVQDRDDFVAFMAREGIQCSVHFRPLHTMTAFREFHAKLPQTEWIGAHIVSLPLFPDLSQSDVQRVAEFVRQWRAQHPLAIK